MKYIITEQQLDKVKEKILKIPFEHFNNNWDLLQKFLNKKGNPHYILDGSLNLYNRQDVKSLGSLIEVKGDLDLNNSPIESIGNLISVGENLDLGDTPIKSLGNLTSVGGWLYLERTPIESLGNLTSVGQTLSLAGTPIKSLGNLTSVGWNLVLERTPISKKYTEQQIRDTVRVGSKLYL